MFLSVFYSENGSNARRKEETAYMLFLDLLHDIEGRYNCVCVT